VNRVRSDLVGDSGAWVDVSESHLSTDNLASHTRWPNDLRAARGEASSDALNEATSLRLMCSSNSETRRRSLATSSKTSLSTLLPWASIVVAELIRDRLAENACTDETTSGSGKDVQASLSMHSVSTRTPNLGSSQVSGHKESPVSLLRHGM